MGGRGSGQYWRFDARDTTDDYRQLDIRRWQRDGLLTPGRTFGWYWSRDDETVASIRVTMEPDRVILSYRHICFAKFTVVRAGSLRSAWRPRGH